MSWVGGSLRACSFLFLAPYARTTRYEEAFLPEGKKRPRSLRSLGLASLVIGPYMLFVFHTSLDSGTRIMHGLVERFSCVFFNSSIVCLLQSARCNWLSYAKPTSITEISVKRAWEIIYEHLIPENVRFIVITLRRIVKYLGVGRIVLHTAFLFLANNALIANWGSSANYRGLVLNPSVPLTPFRPRALTSAPIEPLHSKSDCFFLYQMYCYYLREVLCPTVGPSPAPCSDVSDFAALMVCRVLHRATSCTVPCVL